MKLEDLIKKYRAEHGLSQRQFAKICGISNGYISMIEKGENPKTKEPITPSLGYLQAISSGMGMSLNELFSIVDDMQIDLSAPEYPSPEISNDNVLLDVIGEIAAGYDFEAQEDWSGEKIEVPRAYLKGAPRSDFFVLRVHGDSMYPQYMNGDLVVIRKTPTLDYSGQVGAILYDGDCATLKRVEFAHGQDWLRMVPINPEYPPKTIRNGELEQCRVIGVPVVLIREIEK